MAYYETWYKMQVQSCKQCHWLWALQVQAATKMPLIWYSPFPVFWFLRRFRFQHPRRADGVRSNRLHIIMPERLVWKFHHFTISGLNFQGYYRKIFTDCTFGCGIAVHSVSWNDSHEQRGFCKSSNVTGSAYSNMGGMEERYVWKKYVCAAWLPMWRGQDAEAKQKGWETRLARGGCSHFTRAQVTFHTSSSTHCVPRVPHGRIPLLDPTIVRASGKCVGEEDSWMLTCIFSSQ